MTHLAQPAPPTGPEPGAVVAAPARPPRRAFRRLNVVASVAAVVTSVVLAPLSLVGLAVAATSAASAEVIWPLHRRRRTLRGAVTDLTHAVGNRYLVLPLVVFLVTVIGPLVATLVPGPVRHAVGSLPWWAQMVVVFVISDLFNYAAHRAMHEVPLLWRFHAVHHSSEQLDWLATSRVHPLDLVFIITVASLPAFALGHATEQPLLVTVLFLYPFFAHANAELRLPVLDRVLVSPRFHHWHHAAVPEAHNRNYGAILSVWDRLFRTAHEPDHHPTRYGIGDPDLDAGNYAEHLLSPVMRPH